VRAISWHRRKLAVLCAVTAVLCTIAAASPADPATTPVTVAAHDLTGGHALAEADLRIAHYPEGLAPAGAIVEPTELVGRVLIGDTGSGTPIGRGNVVAPRALNPGDGRALVPVRFDDPAVVGLLQVGDLIDVLAIGGQESPTRTITAGARVLTFPATDSGSGPFGGGDPSGTPVLLEVNTADATELIAAQSRDRLAVVLR
jgi:Flp pilus assembly protein CpaB